MVNKVKIKSFYNILFYVIPNTQIAVLVIDKNQNNIFSDDEVYQRSFVDKNVITFPDVLFKDVEVFDGKKVVKKNYLVQIKYSIIKLYTPKGQLSFDTTLVAFQYPIGVQGDFDYDK